MATTAVATKITGPQVAAGAYQSSFSVVLDTTTAAGILTLDLTAHFVSIESIVLASVTADTGYVVKFQSPGKGVALTSTNIEIGVYEAAADGGPLDSVDSTDVSGAGFFPGMVITVRGVANF